MNDPAAPAAERGPEPERPGTEPAGEPERLLCVHQAPADGGEDGHLHVELHPPLRSADKLEYLAGSERGAGTFVQDTMPEESAAALREAVRRAA